MAYGERKGVRKVPGEYNIADLMGFGLAGGLGIVVAVMVDMTQRGDSSALYTLNTWFSRVFAMVGFGDLPLYGVILIIMAIGASAVIYFQPVTLRGAFAQGFGVLAAVMSFAPNNLGTPLDAPNMPVIQQGSAASTGEADTPEPAAQQIGYDGSTGVRAGLSQAVYVPGTADPAPVRTSMVQSRARASQYDLTMQIVLPDGLEAPIDRMIRRGALRGRLHNADTGQTYNIFRNSGAIIQQSSDGEMLTIMTSIPVENQSSQLYARIEAAGYDITMEEFTASQGSEATWRIVMTPSSVPLVVQRLGESYWF